MMYKFCRCGKQINIEQKYCTECQIEVDKYKAERNSSKQSKERYKRYKNNRTDKEEQRIYQSKAWRHLREIAMQRSHGLCEMCLKQGEINYANDVHHIKPIKLGGDPFDLKNLICLCRSCHMKIHKELNKELNKSSGGNGNE